MQSLLFPPNVFYGWDFSFLGIRIQTAFLHGICLRYLFSFILEQSITASLFLFK